MRTKPVVPRARANRDVETAIDFYLAQGGEAAALRFLDALERAYAFIARHPGAGSPRYAYELDLPGLRCWRLRRSPYLVFTVERDDRIDVWRVLHGERDIPASMNEAETP